MRPKEVTDFLRCGGMNCDCSCERYPNTIGDCMTGRIHDYVIQLEQRVPRWISVEERLPENGVHVLVTAKTPGDHKYVCDAFHTEKFSISSEYGDETACEYNPEKDEFFLGEGWYEVIKNWDDYSSIVIQDQVTHWMPMPELPEEDDHATD